MKETLSYLRKRHPLYMLPSNKISITQISDLIEKLIYRVRQNESMNKGIEKENSVKKQNNIQDLENNHENLK